MFWPLRNASPRSDDLRETSVTVFIISACFTTMCIVGGNYLIKKSQKRNHTDDEGLIAHCTILIFISLLILCLAMMMMYTEMFAA